MAAGEPGDWNSTLISPTVLYITVALIGAVAGGFSQPSCVQGEGGEGLFFFLATAGWLKAPQDAAPEGATSSAHVLNGTPFHGTTFTV